MDTHIQPDPDSNDRRPFQVSLPDDVLDREQGHEPELGHPEVEGGATDTPPASPEERLHHAAERRSGRRRGLLLATAASVLVLGVGAAFVLSPYNTVYPVPRMASTLRHLANQAGVGQPSVLAPSAHLAKVPAPPLPPPGQRDAYVPAPRTSEVNEILALRAGKPAAASTEPAPVPDHAAAHPDGATPAFLPGEPGGPAISSNPSAITVPQSPPATPTTPSALAASSPAPKPGLTQAIVENMRDREIQPGTVSATPQGPGQPATEASSSGPSVPATAGTQKPAILAAAQPPSQPQSEPPAPAQQVDAATAAASLQAAPMSTPEQVQVLELVTRLGTLVADQRREVDQLRADLARSRSDETSRIDDFQRRLTFAEAQRSLAKASAASVETTPSASTPAAAPASETPPAPVRPTLVVARTAIPADGNQPVQRYRVQAASPGLAMLAAIDRAGDEGAQLQVALGDTVPGYGRVKAVVQQGTTWVVKTERGTIGQ